MRNKNGLCCLDDDHAFFVLRGGRLASADTQTEQTPRIVPYLPAVKTPPFALDHNIPAIGNVETTPVEIAEYRFVRVGLDYLLNLSRLDLFARVSEGFEIDFPPSRPVGQYRDPVLDLALLALEDRFKAARAHLEAL